MSITIGLCTSPCSDVVKTVVFKAKTLRPENKTEKKIVVKRRRDVSRSRFRFHLIFSSFACSCVGKFIQHFTIYSF